MFTRKTVSKVRTFLTLVATLKTDRRVLRVREIILFTVTSV